MALMLHVDFSGIDWVGFNSASDAANEFATITVSGLRRQVGGAGGSSSNGTAFDRYSSDRAKYGIDRINWTTGTSASALINIGYNGTTWDLPSQPAGTYTGVVWVRRVSTVITNSFRLVLTDSVSTNFGLGTSTPVQDDWVKLTVTATLASPDDLNLQIVRSVGSTDMNLEIAGAMIVQGSTAPDWFNGGVATLAQDITDYWLENSGWSLGFVRPYQYVAAVGKAELRLSNDDKRFSPEYASGPHYGELLPNLLVQIGDPDYGVWFTGWVDNWGPEPGTNRDKVAKLTATDARRFMANKLPVLPLYNTETPNETIESILGLFELPNTTSGFPTSTETVAWDALAPGLIVDYYADNVPYDHDAVKVMGDILGSLQGKLWFSRTGGYRYRESQGDDTPASYVEIGQDWIAIADAITGQIINKCEVIAHKRKAQTSGPYTIWESDDVPFAIAGLGTEVFRAFFKYDNTRKEVVGALNLSVTETNSGVAGDITAALSDTGANSAVITFTNNNAASRNVTAASITATTRVVQLREISKEYEDSTSITANGTLSERLDFQYTQLRTWAKQLARYRVTRFKDARYEIPWVEINVNAHPDDAFDCHIGAAVHVVDNQTGHDDYYAVIGEVHKVTDGLTNHTVRLYLEPLYATSVADTSSS